jgi:hypothetical protein
VSSNLNVIWSWLKTRVAESTGIVSVESWPYDPVIWISSLRILPDRMPIAHVSLSAIENVINATTDSDVEENTEFAVTVLFNYAGSTQDTLVTLRDSIVTTVLNMSLFNANIKLIDWTSWELIEEYNDIGAFRVNFTIKHVWHL